MVISQNSIFQQVKHDLHIYEHLRYLGWSLFNLCNPGGSQAQMGARAVICDDLSISDDQFYD